VPALRGECKKAADGAEDPGSSDFEKGVGVVK